MPPPHRFLAQSFLAARHVLRRHGWKVWRKAFAAWRELGFARLFATIIDVLTTHRPIDRFYAEWITLYDTPTEDAPAQKRANTPQWPGKPSFTFLMPLQGSEPAARMEASLDSLKAQLRGHWELMLCVNKTSGAGFRLVLQSMLARDHRVRVSCAQPQSPTHRHVPANSKIDAMNAGLAQGTGEFIALINAGDRLAEHALYCLASELIAHGNTDLMFSDEDMIGQNGRRANPWFKGDWNESLMLSLNAFGRLGAMRRSLVLETGGFAADAEDAEHDLVLRCARAGALGRIRHIPHVLYHRHEANAFAPALLREQDLVEAIRKPWLPALPYPSPTVSILIPTTGAARMAGPCLKSIAERTAYSDFEVLLLVSERDAAQVAKLIEGARVRWSKLGHRLRLLVYPQRPFNFSFVNNWGARQASGELLCFLNDDTAVITPQWVERLAAMTSQPGVAAAGPLLLYPDNTIQHAGVILGIGGVGVAGHACHGEREDLGGYFGRACFTQDVSCVTAACIMIRRDVFEAVGGFDEALPVDFNDVDLCMRLRRAGWRIIFTPAVELYHNESASRGRHGSRARRSALARDAALMRQRWGAALENDPFYNPNLSLRRQFQLAFPPRHRP